MRLTHPSSWPSSSDLGLNLTASSQGRPALTPNRRKTARRIPLSLSNHPTCRISPHLPPFTPLAPSHPTYRIPPNIFHHPQPAPSPHFLAPFAHFAIVSISIPSAAPPIPANFLHVNTRPSLQPNMYGRIYIHFCRCQSSLLISASILASQLPVR